MQRRSDCLWLARHLDVRSSWHLVVWGLRGGWFGVGNGHPTGCQQPNCFETSPAANRNLQGLDVVRTRRAARGKGEISEEKAGWWKEHWFSDLQEREPGTGFRKMWTSDMAKKKPESRLWRSCGWKNCRQPRSTWKLISQAEAPSCEKSCPLSLTCGHL